MRLAGWVAHTTKGSGDQGIDVLAERNGIRVVLQCKRYNNSVGNKAVQEAFAAKTFANAQYAAVVTNSTFTPSARALSESTGVLLLHFTDLARPNRLFNLPDVTSSHRPSDVTDAQILDLRNTGLNPTYVKAFCIAFVVALGLDKFPRDAAKISTSQIAPAEPPTAVSSINPSNDGPSKVDLSEKFRQSAGSPSTLKGDGVPGRPSVHAAGELHSKPLQKPRAPLKTGLPAFLRDGSTFCSEGTDFDKRWRWLLSGDRAHEPPTPSCVFIFGQPHPMRVSVLQRVGSNKTMIRVEEGDLVGRLGYTDAYLP